MENSYTRWIELQEEKAEKKVEELLNEGSIKQKDREAVYNNILEELLRHLITICFGRTP